MLRFSGCRAPNQPCLTFGDRAEALFLLVVVIGLMLLIFGLLRLGRLARFVSHSVMTGFLSGVAVVLVLDQLAPLVGYSPEGSNELVQFIDLLAHFRRNPTRIRMAPAPTRSVAGSKPRNAPGGR